MPPSPSYHRTFDAADEPLAVGFGQRSFSRIVQQCRKEKRQTGSRSLLNTGMGLLPASTLTPGHFGTVTGSPASSHANVKSKAVSSPGRSSACTPTGDANASHNPNSRVSPLKPPQDEPPGPLLLVIGQRKCSADYQLPTAIGARRGRDKTGAGPRKPRYGRQPGLRVSEHRRHREVGALASEESPAGEVRRPNR